MKSTEKTSRWDGGFEASEVRRHYADLAPTYEAKANVACSRAYADLVRRTFTGMHRVLEIGAGSGTLLPTLSASLRVACDLSLPMLAAQRPPITWMRVVGDGQATPFGDSSFEGAYAINVLEHVPDPRRFMNQVGRLLAPGGRFLAVTPSGDLERLLDLLERLRIKLPEGPHRFLRFAELKTLADESFRVLEHRTFLPLPIGPEPFVRLVDRLVAGGKGRGLFQYIVVEKPGPAQAR